MADVTLTNGEALSLVQSLNLMTERGRELPFKARYALDKIGRKATDELREFEKARLALCEQYAERDDDGQPKRREDGGYILADQAAFVVAYNQLAAEPITLSGVRKITVDEMGDVMMTDAESVGLAPVIDDAA